MNQMKLFQNLLAIIFSDKYFFINFNWQSNSKHLKVCHSISNLFVLTYLTDEIL